MANKKITELDPSAGLASADLFAVVDDPSGTPATEKATLAQLQTLIDANTLHASRHATGQPDAIAPADIGAATASDLTALTTRVTTAELATREGDFGGLLVADHTLTAADEGKLLPFDCTATRTLTIPKDTETLPDGARFYAMRGTGGNALQIRAGMGHTIPLGDVDIVETGQLVTITIYTGGTTSRVDSFATQAGLDAAEVLLTAAIAGLDGRLDLVERPAAETKVAAYTLTTFDNLKRINLDGTSAVVPITVPQTMAAGDSVFGRCVNADNDCTIIASGTMTLEKYGGGSVVDNGLTTAVVTIPLNATYTIDVEGATRANVYVVDP